MSILDKTFTGIKKVIKCLILSCFYVNILYVSVVLGKPPHEYLSNAFKSVLKNFEENPRMLIPGGSMLLINYDKSKSISQDTEPIEQIPQPFVNTPPASATVNVSPNNLLRDSCDNCGTDLSDQNTDSLVERNDVPHIYKEVNLTIHDNYKVIDLDYNTDSLVEINDNSDNSSLMGFSDHDTDSFVEISDNSDNLFTSLDSTNTPSDSVISQDTEYVIPIDSHSNVNTMSPPVEGAVQEEPIVQKRASVLVAAGRADGDVRAGIVGETGKTGEADVDGDARTGGIGGVPPPETVVSEVIPIEIVKEVYYNMGI